MMDSEGTGAAQSNPLHDIWAAMAPRLQLYLRSFSGLSAHEKADVLQEVMVALWRDCPVGQDAIKPWLYRVARNRAIDSLRRTRRVQARELELPDGPSVLIDQANAAYPSAPALKMPPSAPKIRCL